MDSFPYPLYCGVAVVIRCAVGMSRANKLRMCQGWRIKYLAIGGVCGGLALSRRPSVAQANGRWVTLPGFFISTRACNVARKTAVWPMRSPGRPSRYPKGCSMAASLGTLRAAVRSGMLDKLIVLKPAFSISLCTSPTDQQQIGQPGTRRTVSTLSSFKCRIMAGTLSFNNLAGSKI